MTTVHDQGYNSRINEVILSVCSPVCETAAIGDRSHICIYLNSTNIFKESALIISIKYYITRKNKNWFHCVSSTSHFSLHLQYSKRRHISNGFCTNTASQNMLLRQRRLDVCHAMYCNFYVYTIIMESIIYTYVEIMVCLRFDEPTSSAY